MRVETPNPEGGACDLQTAKFWEFKVKELYRESYLNVNITSALITR